MEEKKNKLSELLTIDYQKGNNRVGFVFSCPGKKERNCGQVCAGATGDNLQILVEYLNNLLPTVFPSSCKDDYRITNASNIVHYKKLTGDTEASFEEIMEPQNLQRLQEELHDCDIIICMGNKATEAVSKIQLHGKVSTGSHLSNCNLNYHLDSKKATPSERKVDRIQQVGKLIISNMNMEDT